MEHLPLTGSDRAPYGLTLIGAGIAATGFGIYWQLRIPGDTHAQSVSLTPTATGALDGIAGRFWCSKGCRLDMRLVGG